MAKVRSLEPKKTKDLWPALRAEAQKLADEDPLLDPILENTVLHAQTLTEAIGRLLAEKLAGKHLLEGQFFKLYEEFAASVPDLCGIIERDLRSIDEHDPAARDWVTPFLFFKGFHALEASRLAHYIWNSDRHHLALFLQNRISDVFGVDIHPAARIGAGVMMDHATGIVIGETAIVEDDVLLWHGVTLGGKSFAPGDRHPKIRKGASIGANATILGNTEVGAGAKIAAGSVVVSDVPDGATAAGVPARILTKGKPVKSDEEF